MTTYSKPIPVPSVDSKAFWEGVKQHELRLPKCSNCGALRFPPSPICPECLSLEWREMLMSGRGKVLTFGVYHRLYHPGFQGDIPYVVGLIELEEGPRLLSNVIGTPPEYVCCDMPVEVTFEDVTPDSTLYKFRPVQQSS